MLAVLLKSKNAKAALESFLVRLVAVFVAKPQTPQGPQRWQKRVSFLALHRSRIFGRPIPLTQQKKKNPRVPKGAEVSACFFYKDKLRCLNSTLYPQGVSHNPAAEDQSRVQSSQNSGSGVPRALPTIVRIFKRAVYSSWQAVCATGSVFLVPSFSRPKQKKSQTELGPRGLNTDARLEYSNAHPQNVVWQP